MAECDGRGGSDLMERRPTMGATTVESLCAELDGLRARLRERDLEMREAAHRADSAADGIAALIAEDIRRTRDPVTRAALETIHRRLDGLRQAQEILRPPAANIEIVAALRRLATALALAYDAANRGIAVGVRGLPLVLGPEQGSIVLLICNELVVNALRYAFRGRSSGRVDVTVGRAASGAPRIQVVDDGVGVSDKTLRTGGAGLSLMQALAHRLDACLRVERTGGTTATLDLPRP